MSNFTERTVPPDWVEVQRKTFTRWCNQQLRPTGNTLQDLEGDLHTGTNLIYLLEELSGTSLGKFYTKPRSRFEELLNVTSGMNFIKSKNIPLVAIGPEDVVDKNQKLVLGLVWMLILRYQIQKGNKDGKMKSAGAAKNELLEWVKQQVKPFGVECNNFNTSFQDGQVLNALVESLKPGSVDIEGIKRVKKDDKTTAFNNTKSAIGKANDLLDIPVLMEAEDFVYPTKPDDLSVMTYVSYFRDYNNKKKDGPTQTAAPKAAATAAGAAKPPASADEINNRLKCLVFGQGVEAPEIGRPNEFLVSIYQATDRKPYEPSPQDKLTVTLYEPTGNGQFKPIELSDVSPSSTGQGHWKTSFTPKQEGGYEVLVKLNGVPVKGRGRIRVRSSEKDVLPAASATGADPKNCTATGEGLKSGEVGKDCKFVIHANNAKNEALKTGGEQFNVEILDKSNNRVPNVIPVVTDNHDGTYGVTYRVGKDGDYNVSIKHGPSGTPIGGSPYGPVTIKPRSGNQVPIDWNKVKIDGLNTKVLKNKPETFKIIPAGENGQKITEGGETFKVAVWNLDLDSKSLPVEVTDNKDGSYKVAYTSDEPGRLKIMISGIDRVHDGAEKKVGTFDAVCVEGELDEDKTEITGDGIKGPVYAYRENSFVIVPKDGNGKFINIDPHSDLAVSITDDSGKPVDHLRIEPESEDDISKGFRVSYTPTKTGKHKYNLASKKKPFKGFPKELDVVEKFDPTKSYCEGKGAEPKVTTKKPMEFKIITVDAKGNKVTSGGDKFEVKIKSEDDPSAKEIKALIRDNGDGTYYVRYSVPKDGKYKMAVTTHNGTKHIKDSPLSITAGIGEDFACLEFASFVGDGKPLTSTVDNFDVEVKGPKDHYEAFSTTDIDIGRYAVNFTPTSGPGVYWISVRLSGNHITNSPFKLEVKGYDNPAAQKQAPTESGVRATRFGVKPITEDGKPIEGFNPADWTTEVRGPPKAGKKLPAKLEQNPDTKQIAVIFTPEHNGLHEVDVKYKGKHIKDSTFTLNVKTVPGEPIIPDDKLFDDEEEEEKPKAAAPAQQPAAAAAAPRTKFAFAAKDKNGHEIKTPVKGNKDWDFEVHGPTDQKVDGAELTEADPTTGKYGVVFPTTQGNGVYKITVKNKGDHVQGSIFRVQVGPVDPAANAGAPASGAGKARPMQFPVKNLPEGGVGKPEEWKAEVLGPPHRVPEDVVPGVQINFDKVPSGGPVGIVFTPQVPGHHKITVTKNGVPVPGSTFNVNIPPWDGAPAAPAAAGPAGATSTQTKTKVGMRKEEEEPSVTKTRGPAWRPIPGASFARFTFGEQVDEEATNKKLSELPLEDLEVGVKDPSGKEVACKIYEKTGVIWQPQLPGDYEVSVYVKGRVVASCPWIVPVSGNQEDMYKSATVKFTVLAKSKDGNNLIVGKSAGMKGEVKGPNGEKVNCKVVSSSEGKGEQEGRYDVVWAPQGPGTYEIVMIFEGHPVAGCPFRVAMGESRGAALPQTQGARTEEDAVDL